MHNRSGSIGSVKVLLKDEVSNEEQHQHNKAHPNTTKNKDNSFSPFCIVNGYLKKKSMRKKNVTFPINVIIENQPINLATERVELSVNNEDGKLGDVVILLFFFCLWPPPTKHGFG